MKRIGIPRALYYYQYYPFWKQFWEDLGFEVVLSRETNKGIVDQGVRCSVDGTCLPVKVYYGHVCDLLTRDVDFLFVPQIISIAEREYICPKFMGLPDMIEKSLKDIPPLISPVIDARKSGWKVMEEYVKLGNKYASLFHSIRAYRNGLVMQQNFSRRLQAGEYLPLVLERRKLPALTTPKLTVGLLGHGYLLYDRLVSMNILERLMASNIKVITPEGIDDCSVERHSRLLRKRMFWTSGKRILSTVSHSVGTVDGLISVAAFACGTDSMTTELVERRTRSKHIPHLLLNLDEHTGEAGVVTRLEAFLDMLERRVLA